MSSSDAIDFFFFLRRAEVPLAEALDADRESFFFFFFFCGW